jgi:hypothetical protein
MNGRAREDQDIDELISLHYIHQPVRVLRTFFRITLALIVFLLFIPSLSSAAQYRVIPIVDGDTIVVN